MNLFKTMLTMGDFNIWKLKTSSFVKQSLFNNKTAKHLMF